MTKLRPWVFFPPFLLLLAAIAANFMGSATIAPNDLRAAGLPSLADKLRQPTNALATCLRGQFSEPTLQALAGYGGADAPVEPLRGALAADLNRILRGPVLCGGEGFGGAALQEGTRRLLARNPAGRALVRLNKMILLDAYPEEIWQSPFLRGVDTVYRWITRTFGWMVSLSALLIVVVCALLFASPFGRVIIGGPQAKPMLTKGQWFMIILTTNIAIGILFWGPVEPLTYFSHPPSSSGIEPQSPGAALFAMSTVLLHWTWTPYAFASLLGVMFAFAFYNMKRPFSLGAPLAPLLGRHTAGRAAQAIDAICLYSLVLGMGASLSAAMMMMGGGLNHVFHIAGPPSKTLMGLIALGILVCSILAAVSGVKRGILAIARVNTAFLAGFLLFIFLFGPTRFILSFAVEGLGNLLSHYFEKVLFTGAAHQDGWPASWTQMQFSGWFAWGPIMSVFLGRIGYGHSVRSFLVFNVLLPALFTGMWMAILCGSLLHMEMFQGLDMVGNLEKNGVEAVLYSFLAHFPLIRLVVPVFLFTAFISFVSTADSNLSAMSGISSSGISEESQESSTVIKVAWGATIGLVAWIMVSSSHLKGVQMLSSLGGLPSMFLCLAVAYCAIRVMLNPSRYDTFQDGYDNNGQPIFRRAGHARDDSAR